MSHTIQESIQADRATHATRTDCPQCGALAESLPEPTLRRPVDPQIYKRWLKARRCPKCHWQNDGAQQVDAAVFEEMNR